MRRRIASDAQYMHDLVIDSHRAINFAAAYGRAAHARRDVLLIDLSDPDDLDRSWIARYRARAVGTVAVAPLKPEEAIALVESTRCPGVVLAGDLLHSPAPTGRIHVVAYSSVVRTLLLAPVSHFQPIVSVIHRGPEKDKSVRVRTTVTYDIPVGPRRRQRTTKEHGGTRT